MRNILEGVTTWIKDNLETSMKLTICEVLFGIPIHDEAIKSINFIIFMGKWFIKKRRTQDKVLNLHTFLNMMKTKIDMIIYNKTINNRTGRMGNESCYNAMSTW